MKLLAFDTATEACSVALLADDELQERFEIAPRRHAELALPWAHALLAEAGMSKSQLDAIAVSRGPGAFTGVRLGIAIAQGIALALDIPVIPVSTLQTLAHGALKRARSGNILSAIDARMGEIYIAAWQAQGEQLTALDTETVLAPDAYQLPDEDSNWHGIGTGFSAQNGALATRLQPRLATLDATALPHASDVARLAVSAHAHGTAIPPDAPEPAYLRNQVALTLREQQAKRGG